MQRSRISRSRPHLKQAYSGAGLPASLRTAGVPGAPVGTAEQERIRTDRAASVDLGRRWLWEIRSCNPPICRRCYQNPFKRIRILPRWGGRLGRDRCSSSRYSVGLRAVRHRPWRSSQILWIGPSGDHGRRRAGDGYTPVSAHPLWLTRIPDRSAVRTVEASWAARSGSWSVVTNSTALQ